MDIVNSLMSAIAAIKWGEVAPVVLTFGVPIIGIVLSSIVSHVGNKISERTGRMQLLEFAHQRIGSANMAASRLAADLEQITFSLKKMVQLSLELQWEAMEDETSDDAEERDREVRTKLRKSILEATAPSGKAEPNLSQTQRSLKEAYSYFANVVEELPTLLRTFADDPFVTAVTRAISKNKGSLPEKVNGLLGSGSFYKHDPLHIARLMTEANSNIAARLQFIVDRFNETPLDNQELIGFMFDYDFRFVPRRRGKGQSLSQNMTNEDIEFVLVNSGMVHLQTMYSMLPSKQEIAKIFDGLIDTKADKITSNYARLTAVDFDLLVDREHFQMFQGFINKPETLILVGRRAANGVEAKDGENEIEWENYDRKRHGPLAKLNLFG